MSEDDSYARASNQERVVRRNGRKAEATRSGWSRIRPFKLSFIKKNFLLLLNNARYKRKQGVDLKPVSSSQAT